MALSDLHTKFRRIRYDVAGIQAGLALARIARLLKYDPDQPRDELGRWTDGGDGANDDATVQPAQYRDGSDLVDLREEEDKGGHAIREHVGKSESYLMSRVRESQRRELDRNRDVDADQRFSGGVAAGTFPSLDAANRLVNATIARNRDQVADVANGVAPFAQIESGNETPTGTEAFAPSLRSQPYIRDTYATRVIVVPDRSSERGWRVVTAYPVRFRERY